MQARPVVIEDLRRFRFVSDPQLSPDGEKVAFVLSDVNIEKDGYDRHIWLADAATGKHAQFTYGEGNDTYPRWSPDGRSLLFLSNGRQPGKKTQLYVIDVAGGEARPVADTELGVSSPPGRQTPSAYSSPPRSGPRRSQRRTSSTSSASGTSSTGKAPSRGGETTSSSLSRKRSRSSSPKASTMWAPLHGAPTGRPSPSSQTWRPTPTRVR